MSYAASGSAVVPKALADINPNYLVRIWGQDEEGNPVGGSNLGIVASSPEEFSIDVSSDWTPILAALAEQNSGILGGLSQKLIGAASLAAQAGGYTAANVAMTQQVWNGTSPIELKLPIKFNAVYNARNEVTLPILYLLSMCLPSAASTTLSNIFGSLAPLRAPGPTINQSGKYNVKISVGRVLIFQNVIITGVSAVFTTLPTSQGDFIAADVDLSIRTGTILTKSALASMFRTNTLYGNQPAGISLGSSGSATGTSAPASPVTGAGVNPNNIVSGYGPTINGNNLLLPTTGAPGAF